MEKWKLKATNNKCGATYVIYDSILLYNILIFFAVRLSLLLTQCIEVLNIFFVFGDIETQLRLWIRKTLDNLGDVLWCYYSIWILHPWDVFPWELQ